MKTSLVKTLNIQHLLTCLKIIRFSSVIRNMYGTCSSCHFKQPPPLLAFPKAKTTKVEIKKQLMVILKGDSSLLTVFKNGKDTVSILKGTKLPVPWLYYFLLDSEWQYNFQIHHIYHSKNYV